MIEFKNVYKKYATGTEAVNNANFKIEKGSGFETASFFIISLYENRGLVADALFGILVEDVDTGGIDSNLDGVACLSLGTRGNSCDNVLTVGCVFKAFFLIKKGKGKIYLHITVNHKHPFAHHSKGAAYI